PANTFTSDSNSLLVVPVCLSKTCRTRKSVRTCARRGAARRFGCCPERCRAGLSAVFQKGRRLGLAFPGLGRAHSRHEGVELGSLAASERRPSCSACNV